jgi:hypothetical protein
MVSRCACWMAKRGGTVCEWLDGAGARVGVSEPAGGALRRPRQ